LVDVVVTTGGSGTVLAMLQAGVPLVVVPAAWDQPENAWRVADAGAGIRLAPRQCTPARLRASVEAVLHNPTYRGNAGRLAAAFKRYGGAAQAAGLLEELVANADRPATPLASPQPQLQVNAAGRAHNGVATIPPGAPGAHVGRG
jgi:UDP:flavonoid glycosyltransferase YjiC (YdhE family)